MSYPEKCSQLLIDFNTASPESVKQQLTQCIDSREDDNKFTQNVFYKVLSLMQACYKSFNVDGNVTQFTFDFQNMDEIPSLDSVSKNMKMNILNTSIAMLQTLLHNVDNLQSIITSISNGQENADKISALFEVMKSAFNSEVGDIVVLQDEFDVDDESTEKIKSIMEDLRQVVKILNELYEQINKLSLEIKETVALLTIGIDEGDVQKITKLRDTLSEQNKLMAKLYDDYYNLVSDVSAGTSERNQEVNAIAKLVKRATTTLDRIRARLDYLEKLQYNEVIARSQVEYLKRILGFLFEEQTAFKSMSGLNSGIAQLKRFFESKLVNDNRGRFERLQYFKDALDRLEENYSSEAQDRQDEFLKLYRRNQKLQDRLNKMVTMLNMYDADNIHSMLEAHTLGDIKLGEVSVMEKYNRLKSDHIINRELNNIIMQREKAISDKSEAELTRFVESALKVNEGFKVKLNTIIAIDKEAKQLYDKDYWKVYIKMLRKRKLADLGSPTEDVTTDISTINVIIAKLVGKRDECNKTIADMNSDFGKVKGIEERIRALDPVVGMGALSALSMDMRKNIIYAEKHRDALEEMLRLIGSHKTEFLSMMSGKQSSIMASHQERAGKAMSNIVEAARKILEANIVTNFAYTEETTDTPSPLSAAVSDYKFDATGKPDWPRIGGGDGDEDDPISESVRQAMEQGKSERPSLFDDEQPNEDFLRIEDLQYDVGIFAPSVESSDNPSLLSNKEHVSMMYNIVTRIHMAIMAMNLVDIVNNVAKDYVTIKGYMSKNPARELAYKDMKELQVFLDEFKVAIGEDCVFLVPVSQNDLISYENISGSPLETTYTTDDTTIHKVTKPYSEIFIDLENYQKKTTSLMMISEFQALSKKNLSNLKSAIDKQRGFINSLSTSFTSKKKELGSKNDVFITSKNLILSYFDIKDIVNYKDYDLLKKLVLNVNGKHYLTTVNDIDKQVSLKVSNITDVNALYNKFNVSKYDASMIIEDASKYYEAWVIIHKEVETYIRLLKRIEKFVADNTVKEYEDIVKDVDVKTFDSLDALFTFVSQLTSVYVKSKKTELKCDLANLTQQQKLTCQGFDELLNDLEKLKEGESSTVVKRLHEYMDLLDSRADALFKVRVMVNASHFTPARYMQASVNENLRTLIHEKNMIDSTQDTSSKNYVYGPFFNVYRGGDGISVAADITNMFMNANKVGAKPMHFIYSAYGYSGSGKTYTLTEKENERSVINLLFTSFAERYKSDKSFSIKYLIYDYYGELDDGNCIVSIDPPLSDDKLESTDYATLSKHRITVYSKDGDNSSVFDYKKDTSLSAFMSTLDTSYFRKIEAFDDETVDVVVKDLAGVQRRMKVNADPSGSTEFHIRLTPNNDESSRAHTFIDVYVMHANDTCIGRVTLMDMAGSENVNQIQQTYFETIPISAINFAKLESDIQDALRNVVSNPTNDNIESVFSNLTVQQDTINVNFINDIETWKSLRDMTFSKKEYLDENESQRNPDFNIPIFTVKEKQEITDFMYLNNPINMYKLLIGISSTIGHLAKLKCDLQLLLTNYTIPGTTTKIFDSTVDKDTLKELVKNQIYLSKYTTLLFPLLETIASKSNNGVDFLKKIEVMFTSLKDSISTFLQTNKTLVENMIIEIEKLRNKNTIGNLYYYGYAQMFFVDKQEDIRINGHFGDCHYLFNHPNKIKYKLDYETFTYLHNYHFSFVGDESFDPPVNDRGEYYTGFDIFIMYEKDFIKNTGVNPALFSYTKLYDIEFYYLKANKYRADIELIIRKYFDNHEKFKYDQNRINNGSDKLIINNHTLNDGEYRKIDDSTLFNNISTMFENAIKKYHCPIRNQGNFINKTLIVLKKFATRLAASKPEEVNAEDMIKKEFKKDVFVSNILLYNFINPNISFSTKLMLFIAVRMDFNISLYKELGTDLDYVEQYNKFGKKFYQDNNLPNDNNNITDFKKRHGYFQALTISLQFGHCINPYRPKGGQEFKGQGLNGVYYTCPGATQGGGSSLQMYNGGANINLDPESYTFVFFSVMIFAVSLISTEKLVTRGLVPYNTFIVVVVFGLIYTILLSVIALANGISDKQLTYHVSSLYMLMGIMYFPWIFSNQVNNFSNFLLFVWLVSLWWTLMTI